MYCMGTLLKKDIPLLEDVQIFALKMCTKLWNQDYQSLLSMSHLPSLESRRQQPKLSWDITMLSDHLEKAHSCLSTTTPISMGNHSYPVPSMRGTLCPPPFKQAQPLDHLSMLLIFNISSASFIMLINNIILCIDSITFRLHSLY